MSEPSKNQIEAVEYAVAVLKEADIDARLIEMWRGGEKRLAILMRNLSNLESHPCPHGYANWDDCPDCRH